MTSIESFNVADGRESGVLRIMLVADGEPQHGGLEPLSYGMQRRALLDGFFTRQREQIIWEAHENADRCRGGTKVYVMTTGHGAVPLAESPPIYNVPGELSIAHDEYRSKYRQSFISMLAPQETTTTIAAIVYYASVSKKVFREGVFQILAEICQAHQASDKVQVRACMFGARHHPSDRWLHLCDIYDALVDGKAVSLENIRSHWLHRYHSIAPFFEWFYSSGFNGIQQPPVTFWPLPRLIERDQYSSDHPAIPNSSHPLRPPHRADRYPRAADGRGAVRLVQRPVRLRPVWHLSAGRQ